MYACTCMYVQRVVDFVVNIVFNTLTCVLVNLQLYFPKISLSQILQCPSTYAIFTDLYDHAVNVVSAEDSNILLYNIYVIIIKLNRCYKQT